MQLFRNRPLATGCAIFIVLMYISYFASDVVRVLFVALPTLIIGVAFLANYFLKGRIIKNIARYIAIPLALILCGCVSLFSFSVDEKTQQKYINSESEQTFEIISTESSMVYGSKYIAYCGGIDTKVLLKTNDMLIEDGDIIKANTLFSSLDKKTLGYNEYGLYLDKGIRLVAEIDEYEVVSKDNSTFLSGIKKANLWLDSMLQDSLNSDTYPVISALFLGNRNNLDNSLTRDFSRLGVSHVLSLSGMHLSLITALIGFFLLGLKIDKRIKLAILEAIIIFYALLTGFSESMLRSALMLTLFYLFFYLRDKPDTVTTLFFSVTLIISVFPYYIFSTSLILSFFAVLACICSGKLLSRFLNTNKIRIKILKYFIFTIVTSISVSIFTLPIMYLKFGSFSIISPIANIIVIPIFTVILYLVPFLLLFCKVPYVSQVFVFICEKLVAFVTFITSSLAKLDFVCISFKNAIHIVAVITIAIFVITLLVLPKKRLKISFMGICVGVLIFAFGSIYSNHMGRSNVFFTTFSHSSSDIVCVESENKLMVFDISRPSKTNSSYANSLSSYLGYTKIDTYIMCDYSSKMEEAFDYLSDNTYINKLKIPTPLNEDEEKISFNISKIAEKKNIEFSFIQTKDTFGKTTVDYMAEEKLARSVKRIISFSIKANNSKFSYLGASSYETTNLFPTLSAQSSDVIIFGSYGPSFSVEYQYNVDTLDYADFLGDSGEYCKVEFYDSISSKIPNKENGICKYKFKKSKST